MYATVAGLVNFAEAMSEINGLRVENNLKEETEDLRTCLDAAWIKIEALKQQDEQNKLQLTQLEKKKLRSPGRGISDQSTSN